MSTWKAGVWKPGVWRASVWGCAIGGGVRFIIRLTSTLVTKLILASKL